MLYCKLFGHDWRFKNYSNSFNYKLKPYDYLKSKRCKRCGHREVLTFSGEWKIMEAEKDENLILATREK
jgi:hypothetical protein